MNILIKKGIFAAFTAAAIAAGAVSSAQAEMFTSDPYGNTYCTPVCRNVWVATSPTTVCG